MAKENDFFSEEKEKEESILRKKMCFLRIRRQTEKENEENI